jgi:hypothetical protein
MPHYHSGRLNPTVDVARIWGRCADCLTGNHRVRRRCSPCLSGEISLFLCCALSALVLAGCGGEKIATYPVTGTVHVDDKPAEGAIVIFCPTDGSDQFKRERPMGTSDSSGRFQLTTFLKGDGAPAGNYQVMIRWPAPKKRGTADEDDPHRSAAEFDALGGRYFDPAKSGLTATTSSGPTDLTPFELKSK